MVFRFIALALVVVAVVYFFPSTEDGQPIGIFNDAGIRAEIVEHPSLWFKNVDVSTRGETVILKGELDNQEQLDTLLKFVRAIPTVKKVENYIVLKDQSGLNADKDLEAPEISQFNGLSETDATSTRELSVVQQAENILKSQSDTANIPVELNFDGGVLTVAGKVPDKLAMIEIEVMLSDIPGVTRVVVQPQAELPSERYPSVEKGAY